MEIEYSIQKFDFFPDQFDEKGKVDLDSAIGVFQNFEFLEQLKSAERLETTSCIPTIIYKSNKGKKLTISAFDGNGFSLLYETAEKEVEFFISNNFEENPSGILVEEFIEMFYEQTIENELILVNKEQIITEEKEQIIKPTNKNVIIYSFKDKGKLRYFLWSLPWLIISIILAYYNLKSGFQFGWYYVGLVCLFWFPALIVHLSYWFKNKNARVLIDRTEKTLTYEKDGEIIKFNRSDIKLCEWNHSNYSRSTMFEYSYLWFVLNDKRKIVITNFVTEPENIINALNLKYSSEKRTAPFLPI
ncbi:hypothetical protein LV84_04305 [Algoriphagus ratkowskyi]|uniref:PH domain-containing protein n=1 Tax=Algoriphagus ratkowskyi TaxID=57028 RepID=A0A2W7QKJ3_9BACT|nr:hypothetical protein [Algoriphagus ratkowskyi]PZX49028.1 hypothetical protein LV84_04305 [Algoriphagus ratkowskyi]TXD75323.1 hypothetical protein ESW18_20910 [Algoriphagus ratkowskyi]